MGLSPTVGGTTTTTTLGEIAANEKTVSGFWLAHDLAHKTGNEELARHVYRCAYGINELLLSSFKLHKNQKDLVIDPWEVILTELSFLFEAPMVVARVKRRHGEVIGPDYFIRTNVRNAEYEFIVGQQRKNCELVDGALIGEKLRDKLLDFFRAHSSAPTISDLPLAFADYPGTETFRAAFESEAKRYHDLLVELQNPDESEKQRIYEKEFKLQNPDLLHIGGVATMALYYVRRDGDAEPEFVGTIELYLPKVSRLPAILRNEDISKIVGHIALMVSLVSINGLCLNGPEGQNDDFDSYSHSPTVELGDMPSFHEYGKDLKDYIEKVMNGAGGYDDSMETESSLPAVFNDLYLQMKRLFEREGFRKDDFQIAFVVPEHPDNSGNSVGRYYFPSKFIDDLFTEEVLGDFEKRERIKGALDALMVSGHRRSSGLPLNLGLLGYVNKTLFPAFTYKIDADARAKSYDNKQQELELELFSQSSDISVIEFPLVLFFDKKKREEKRQVYPTYLIAFLAKRGEKEGQPQALSQLLSHRGRHHLYALVYHARYALAKAFAAETFREKQVEQLSIVVHDMDRMNRLFTANIVGMAGLVDTVSQISSALTEQQRRELNNLQGSAVAISDYLQFSQYLTDKKRSFPGITSEGVLSEKISLFQAMFSSVNRSDGAWPGWVEPTVRLDPKEKLYRVAKDSEGKNRLDEKRCEFVWPQGALTGILWNLSANANDVYKSEYGKVQWVGALPSINCDVGRLSNGVAEATFIIRFPGINFRIGKVTKPGEVCREPDREVCSGCPHKEACAPHGYADTLFSFSGPTEGRGMRSCQQIIKSWSALINPEVGGYFGFDKAGLPEVIKITVPIEFLGKKK